MNKPRIFISHSVPYSDPLTGTNRDVWDAIEKKIRWCQVVLLMAGVHASYSGSIKREIEFANNLNKPIIAIVPLGAARTSSLTGHATAVVGWRTESIVTAIRNILK